MAGPAATVMDARRSTAKMADRVFVDTNILVYATQSDSVWHADALVGLDDLRHNFESLVISPQIVREYLASVTRGGGSLAPMRLALAIRNLTIIRRQFVLVDETDE